MLLEVELSGVWSASFNYFEDLQMLSIDYLIETILASYFDCFRNDLFTFVSWSSSAIELLELTSGPQWSPPKTTML